jgi:hypothetical protein
MTAVNQPIWRLTPSEALPMPPGSLGVIMGQATLATSSATISVPFGGAALVSAFCQLEGTATATVGAGAVISRTITTSTTSANYVTIKGLNSTNGVVNYLLIGHMDQADASV